MSDDAADYMRAAFGLIVALRGGWPASCDFCHQPFSETRYPVPEEAAAWACNECEARWARQRKAPSVSNTRGE